MIYLYELDSVYVHLLKYIAALFECSIRVFLILSICSDCSIREYRQSN